MAAWLWLSTLALPGSGCSPRFPYRVHAGWPQKDVVLLTVRLESPLEPAGYRDIARREAARLRSRATPSGYPVYEVRLDFFLVRPDEPGRRLATVSVPTSDPADLARLPSVVLYDGG